MKKKTTASFGLAALAACALAVGLVAPSSADQQPRSTDAVGVGSDTVQYVSDFVDDGDASAHAGYNATNTARRVWSFDATTDGSGRAVYGPGGVAISPSIVLRAGTKPQTRPNGSGAGITALLNDGTHQIDFVRSSRLPSATEQASAVGAASFGGQGIHVYQIATDGMLIATNVSGSHVPAGGLSCATLVQIYKGAYKKWTDIPGNSAGSSDGIVPVIPQSGSGTAKDFLASLATCNGGVAITLGSNVKTGEEHDPASITSSPTSPDVNGNTVTNADTISPFSTGRNNLINSGYFGGTPAPNTITLLPGGAATTDSSTSYTYARTLYILCRDVDVTSATPFQVGGLNNLVNTLFGTSTSWYAKASNSALFTSAGVTQSWADLGVINS